MSLVEVGFEVHRGLIAESAVEPLAVVEDFQPLEDRRLGLGASGKLAAMHQLALQAAPEALDHGVVVAVAFAAHAGLEAGSGEPLPIRFAGVFPATIGMMDQPVGRLALRQGHVQCRQRQTGGQRIAHRPTHTAAAAAIQYTGHVEPAFGRGHVGDVGHPDRIGTRRLVATQQPIGGDGQIVIAVGQADAEAAARSAAQAGPAHESRNAMATAPVTTQLQPARHARTAVGVATSLVGLRDQRQQRRVGLRRRFRPTLAPA